MMWLKEHTDDEPTKESPFLEEPEKTDEEEEPQEESEPPAAPTT